MRSYLAQRKRLLTRCPHCLNDVLNPTLNQTTGGEIIICMNVYSSEWNIMALKALKSDGSIT